MAFQFKIQIRDITYPPVWRRLLVPAQFTFHRFHNVIQQAFGWDDYHLFHFSPQGYGSRPVICIPYEEDFFEIGEEQLDAKKIRLKDVFTAINQKYTYIYDFGDDWIHKITLEKITAGNPLRAACIAGKGACPPEDCGGYRGYATLKKILANPKHPEHTETKQWLGLSKNEQWNAAAFDLKTANEMVANT